jgi:hypothetical protein
LEKNYRAFVTEMQAAVYGMTYFQHYLVTRKFTLSTDHKPLCKLSSTHEEENRKAHPEAKWP